MSLSMVISRSRTVLIELKKIFSWNTGSPSTVHRTMSCGVVSGCTGSSPKILVEDVSTETWTSVKAVVGDLLLALRGDEVLFVREVDGPADVTVVAS